MDGLSAHKTTALALLLVSLLGCSSLTQAARVAVALDGYFEFSGKPGGEFFHGTFLTGSDLQTEQDYMRPDLKRVVSKYIGETERNLDVIFDRVGESNMMLFFDETDALFSTRTDVEDAHSRYDDFIVLDESTHRWRGQIVLQGNQHVLPGLYDLAGTFQRAPTTVPEPASAVLVVSGLAGLLSWRWRRTPRRG